MTLTEKISLFVPKAITKVRVLTTELTGEFDYSGYQSDRSEELLLMISETNDFIKLLDTDTRGGLTEREISDLIDFFVKWLQLFDVIAANYRNYTMPIAGNVIVTPGNYATNEDLQQEIIDRQEGDTYLLQLIEEIQNIINNLNPNFPDGFWNNYISTYTVVFDDDARLHTHANKAILDEIDANDLLNIKALNSHFESIGEPDGQHVSQEDRDRWNQDSDPVSSTVFKIQAFTADGITSVFSVTGGVVDQVCFVTINGNVQDPALYSRIENNFNFGENIPAGWKVVIAYFEGLSVGGGGSAGVYDLSSPTSLTVGGIPAGTNLTGRTWQSIVEELLVDYLLPAFSSFDLTEIASIIEVGVALSGSKTATWSITNIGNVQDTSIAVRDVTSNVVIATGLNKNAGSASVNIGTIVNTAPITRQWRAEGLNTNAQQFVSALKTVNSIYPFFFGKVASGGLAPGLGRPAANQALINSGTKVVAASNGTIAMVFNSTSDDYVWFAIPVSSATKISWFVDALNQGTIGGAVSPGGNLFPDHTLVEIDSPSALWNDVQYKIYISNYQTAINLSMQMRNS